MNRFLVTPCLLAAFACGGANASKPPAQPAPVAAPPDAAASAGDHHEKAESTPAQSRPASPFYVIGSLPGEVRIFGVGERALVAGDGAIVYALAGDDVLHDPILQHGMSTDPFFALSGIAGSWPDAAWLSTTHPAGRTGFTKLWRWNGKQWALRQSTPESHFVEFIKPWTGGRHLALEQAGMMFDARFLVLSGDKNVTVPAITRRRNPQSTCYTELRVQAFDTLPTGEVVIAGLRCGADDSTDGLGVERWAPGAQKSSMETLPGSEALTNRNTSLDVVGMALRSATDITVVGQRHHWDETTKKGGESNYVAVFDGTRWREVTSQLPGIVTSLDTTSDRSLAVTTDRGDLYLGSSFETLALVPLPAELYAEAETTPRISSVWSPASGDVWADVELMKPKNAAGARPPSRYVLLHTRPATKPLPTPAEFEQKERSLRLPGPPFDWCATPFVLLYTLGKKAPADYDYPATRAALKGHREFAVPGVEFIEFERLDRRYFGARVPDFTLGAKLAKLVKETVPGSTPELVCHDPPPKRTLAVDLEPATAAKAASGRP